MNQTPDQQQVAIAKLSGEVLALEMALRVIVAQMTDEEHQYFMPAYDATIDSLLGAPPLVPLPEEARVHLSRVRDRLLRRRDIGAEGDDERLATGPL